MNAFNLRKLLMNAVNLRKLLMNAINLRKLLMNAVNLRSMRQLTPDDQWLPWVYHSAVG
jgi:hypothetical protein